jgi:hypothetical protein
LVKSAQLSGGSAKDRETLRTKKGAESTDPAPPC